MVWYRYVIAMERAWQQRLCLLVRLAITSPWLWVCIWACAWAGCNALRISYCCAGSVDEAESRARELRGAIEQFRVEHEGRCPTSIAALARQGFLSREPLDPWGRPYTMRCESGPSFALEVRSAGADGSFGGADEMVAS
jgi:Type II secretion system (T2SS), protein G